MMNVTLLLCKDHFLPPKPFHYKLIHIIYFLLFNALLAPISFISICYSTSMSGYGSFSSLCLIKEIDMMAISCDDKIDTFTVINAIYLLCAVFKFFLAIIQS